MRILLVEDHPATSRWMEAVLTKAGLNVFATGTGEEAVTLAKAYEHDVILLDLSLPDMTGHDVLRRLRAECIATPVMILTADGTAGSKVGTLQHGADDYMTKPVDRDELLARLNAIVRRTHGFADSVIRTGPLSVNIDAKVVEAGGTAIKLTKREYQFFELLSLRKSRVVSKEMFLDHLYGGLHEPCFKIVDVFICKLRRKIEDAAGAGALIETVWGRGYRLNDPGGADPALMAEA